MDGNGRWAQARGLPRAAGHRQGVEALRRTVAAAGELGLRYLTVYGFSSENWRRPAQEVEQLMGLLRLYLRRDVQELKRRGVRLRVIGDRDRLPRDIRRLIEVAEAETLGQGQLDLVVALSYGGRQEIVSAVQKLMAAAGQGELHPEEIDESALRRGFDLPDLPDPEIIIRTSGEQRLSNFLLWQAAESELVFVDCLWPDFTGDLLAEIVTAYGARETTGAAFPAVEAG